MTSYAYIYSVVDIIQPTKNSQNVTFDESTNSVQLMCSLNIDIPSSVTVTWLHNNNITMTTSPNEITQTGNTTTLVIGNPQPSDAGVYQCVFNDTVDHWTLRRNIILQDLCKYDQEFIASMLTLDMMNFNLEFYHSAWADQRKNRTIW